MPGDVSNRAEHAASLLRLRNRGMAIEWYIDPNDRRVRFIVAHPFGEDFNHFSFTWLLHEVLGDLFFPDKVVKEVEKTFGLYQEPATQPERQPTAEQTPVDFDISQPFCGFGKVDGPLYLKGVGCKRPVGHGGSHG